MHLRTLRTLIRTHDQRPLRPSVQSITATDTDVQVAIENQGDVPVTDELWVEAYVDPNPAPTAVNQLWWDRETPRVEAGGWKIESRALRMKNRVRQ
jgi:hypothetical protein